MTTDEKLLNGAGLGTVIGLIRTEVTDDINQVYYSLSDNITGLATTYVQKTSVVPTAGITGTAIATIDGKTIYAPVTEEGIQEETDPIFTASPAANITSADITKWNGVTSLVSNIQSDWNATTGLSTILNKPEIPNAASFTSTYDDRYVNVTGDTMTGPLEVESDQGYGLIVKSILDSDKISFCHSSAIEMPAATLSIGINNYYDTIVLGVTNSTGRTGTVGISGVATPSDDYDAANKIYVDDVVYDAMSTVSATATLATGTTIGKITINGQTTTFYAPSVTVPVTSVNGATGNVVLDAYDISYSATQSIKDKIDDIVTAGGEPNVIETVKVNGTALTPTNKEVNVIVPTISATSTLSSGTEIGSIIVDNVTTTLYAPDQEIFWASYGNTQVSEIMNAYLNHKLCLVNYHDVDNGVNEYYYLYKMYSTWVPPVAEFLPLHTTSETTIKLLECDGDGWSARTLSAPVRSVTATSALTTGITVGTVDINGTTTTFYAPTVDLTPYATKTYAEGLTSGLAKTTDLTSYVAKSDVTPVAGVTGTAIATISGKTIYAPVAEGGVQTETDPVFTASAAYGITATDIANWNAKSSITPVNADWNATTGLSTILNKPSLGTAATHSHSDYALANHTHSYSELSNTPDLSSFITSADIPVTDVQVNSVSVLNGTIANIDLSGYPTVGMISGFANISDVPYITPEGNGDTLIATITQNGSTFGLYAPAIPQNVSDLNNDAGYITSTDLADYVPTSRTVNGKTLTANISLTASDVGAMSTSHVANTITATDISNWNSKSSVTPVQSDWNVTTTTSLAYIQNKPEVGYHSAQLVIDGSDNITFADPNDNFASLLARIENNQTIRLGALSGDPNLDINIEDTYHDANTIIFTDGKQSITLNRTAPTIVITQIPDYSGFYIVEVQEQSGNYSLVNDTAASIIDRYDHHQVMYVRETGRPQLFRLFQVEDFRGDSVPSSWTLGFQFADYVQYEEFLISNNGTVTYSSHNYVAAEYNSTNTSLDITT